MMIPVPPQQTRLLGPGGTLNPSWANFHSQTYQQISYNLNVEGYRLPQMDADKLTSIASDKGTTIAYNSTTSRAVINNDGEYENIATDPKSLSTAAMTTWAAEKDSDGKFLHNGKTVYDSTVDKTYVVNNGVPKEV